MQRPHPAHRGPPAHRFRPRQLGDGFGQKLRQHLGRRPALAGDHRDVQLLEAGLAPTGEWFAEDEPRLIVPAS